MTEENKTYKTMDELPAPGKTVLIFHRDEWKLGCLFWEHPTFEDTFNHFMYWDCPINEGQDYEWFDVTHWTELPSSPEELTEEELIEWRSLYIDKPMSLNDLLII